MYGLGNWGPDPLHRNSVSDHVGMKVRGGGSGPGDSQHFTWIPIFGGVQQSCCVGADEVGAPGPAVWRAGRAVQCNAVH